MLSECDFNYLDENDEMENKGSGVEEFEHVLHGLPADGAARRFVGLGASRVRWAPGWLG